MKEMDIKINNYIVAKRERFLQYYDRLKSIAVSRIQYQNMPKEIDVRYMNQILYEMGYAVFYYDKWAMRYVALKCMLSGELDIYDIPSIRIAYANNGYQYELNPSNSVILWNNYLHKPDTQTIIYFATRLANAEAVVDINMKTQKTPIIILSPQEEKLSMKTLLEKYEDDAEVIHAYKNLNMDNIKALNLNSPFIADKAQDIKNQIWNEALTYLGIPNISINKKERLITDEVQRMQGGVLASSGGHLEMRKENFNEVNNMFGLNIKVVMPSQENNVSRETSNSEGDNYE